MSLRTYVREYEHATAEERGATDYVPVDAGSYDLEVVAAESGGLGPVDPGHEPQVRIARALARRPPKLVPTSIYPPTITDTPRGRSTR